MYYYNKTVTMSIILTKEQIEQLLDQFNYGFYTTVELHKSHGCLVFCTFLKYILNIYITMYFECDKYKISDIDTLIEDKIQLLLEEAIITFLRIARSVGLRIEFEKKFQLMSPVEDIIAILSVVQSKKYVIADDNQLFKDCMNIIKITVVELHKINAIYKLI